MNITFFIKSKTDVCLKIPKVKAREMSQPLTVLVTLPENPG